MEEAEAMKACWYYHGWLPRWEVESLLLNEGEWLVLEEDPDGIPSPIFAVRAKGIAQVVYIRVYLGTEGRLYVEDSQDFANLSNLVGFYVGMRRELVKGSGAVLQRPVWLREWSILPEEVEKWKGDGSDELGKGCFGSVKRGILARLGGVGEEEVALKECQVSGATERSAFFQESLYHLQAAKASPNVAKLLGVVTMGGGCLRSLMEFLPLGDLGSYLKKAEGRDTDDSRLLSLALDVCMALEAMGSLRMLHLDVAARNCLLKEDEGGLRALLSDFGLARVGEVYLIQGGDYVSKRWAAPETMRVSPPPEATAKSDVWSFGVLLWELWARASLPYPDLADTQGLLVRLYEGYRMEPPKHFPSSQSLRSLLRSTWAEDPSKRPTFTQIKLILSDIIKDTATTNA